MLIYKFESGIVLIRTLRPNFRSSTVHTSNWRRWRTKVEPGAAQAASYLAIWLVMEALHPCRALIVRGRLSWMFPPSRPPWLRCGLRHPWPLHFPGPRMNVPPMNMSRHPSGPLRRLRRPCSLLGRRGPRGWCCLLRLPYPSPSSPPPQPASANNLSRSARQGLRSCVRSAGDVVASHVKNLGRCRKSGSATIRVWCLRTVSLTMRPVCVVSRDSSTIVRNQTGAKVVRTIRAAADQTEEPHVGGASQLCRAFYPACGCTGPSEDVKEQSKHATPDIRGLDAVADHPYLLPRRDCWTRVLIFRTRVRSTAFVYLLL